MTISTDFSQRGWMSFAAFDLNGVGGLGGADLAAWAADYFAGTKHLRSDYDGDGSLGGADLSILAQAYFAGGSLQSASSLAGGLCP